MPVQNSPGLIPQDERLFTVRSRGFTSAQNDGGSRGTRARIRILSDDPQKSVINRAAEGFASFTEGEGPNALDKLLNKNPGQGFSDFLLTDVSVNFNEKVQITQTFGDTETVYYFGKAPVIYNIAGLLIDDIDNQWFTQFVDTYGGLIRGTESARNYELIEITLPNVQLTGTVMSFSYSQNSSRDTDIPFNMQVHAKSIIPIPVRIPNQIPDNIAGKLVDFGKAAGFTTFSEINKIKQTTQKDMLQAAIDDGISAQARAENSTNPTLFSAPQAGTSPAQFQASIFSPVFGVLTSITKVVKDTTGNISTIISSFTSPVNTVLRDIQGISTQAIGIARTAERGITNIVNKPLSTLQQLRDTIISLKNAAGVISRMPQTVSQSIKRLKRFGHIATSAAILGSGTQKQIARTAALNSGSLYTPENSGNFKP